MKRYITGVMLLFMIIGLLHYIPIGYCPEYLNDLYYEHQIAIVFSILFILALILVFHTTPRSMGIFFSYLVILMLNKEIQDWNNNLIIWINSGRQPAEFYVPVLGYRIVSGYFVDTTTVMFKYNNNFGGFRALVYQKAHGLNEHNMENNETAEKIYNADWWLYSSYPD